MKNFSSKMKESYPHNSRGRKIRNIVLLSLCLFVVLYGGKDLFSKISMNLTMPFYYVRHYINTSSATVPVFLRGRMELLQRIQDLEQQVEESRGSGVATSFITTENQELRALLGSSTTSLILAGVVSQPPHTPYDTMIIDRGSAEGVQKNAPVFYGKQHVLGYVREVTTHSALVTLLSSPGVESTVYIFGPNIFTTAYGEGGGVIHITIPQGLTLTKGDIVVTPSVHAGILGTISDVQSVPTEPEQHAYVTFDVPMQSIRLVAVGTDPVELIDFETVQSEIQKAREQLFMINIPPEALRALGTTTIPHGTTSSSTITTP